MEKWYVARSKPRNEELLWKQFCLLNLESYYPRIKVKTVNPRARQTQPYFPGYLFVRIDLEIKGISIVEWMPGGVGLVTFGDEPAFISDSLVHEIKQRIEHLETASSEKTTPLSKGDPVLIHEGIFSGYEAIFDKQLSGTDRARVLLSLLDNRQLPVDLSIGCIRRPDQH